MSVSCAPRSSFVIHWTTLRFSRFATSFLELQDFLQKTNILLLWLDSVKLHNDSLQLYMVYRIGWYQNMVMNAY
jgi:hypothetical protein